MAVAAEVNWRRVSGEGGLGEAVCGCGVHLSTGPWGLGMMSLVAGS
jgi:hypothetical protein